MHLLKALIYNNLLFTTKTSSEYVSPDEHT